VHTEPRKKRRRRRGGRLSVGRRCAGGRGRPGVTTASETESGSRLIAIRDIATLHASRDYVAGAIRSTLLDVVGRRVQQGQIHSLPGESWVMREAVLPTTPHVAQLQRAVVLRRTNHAPTNLIAPSGGHQLGVWIRSFIVRLRIGDIAWQHRSHGQARATTGQTPPSGLGPLFRVLTAAAAVASLLGIGVLSPVASKFDSWTLGFVALGFGGGLLTLAAICELSARWRPATGVGFASFLHANLVAGVGLAGLFLVAVMAWALGTGVVPRPWPPGSTSNVVTAPTAGSTPVSPSSSTTTPRPTVAIARSITDSPVPATATIAGMAMVLPGQELWMFIQPFGDRDIYPVPVDPQGASYAQWSVTTNIGDPTAKGLQFTLTAAVVGTKAGDDLRSCLRQPRCTLAALPIDTLATDVVVVRRA
jgi:hypothetical protein